MLRLICVERRDTVPDRGAVSECHGAGGRRRLEPAVARRIRISNARPVQGCPPRVARNGHYVLYTAHIRWRVSIDHCAAAPSEGFGFLETDADIASCRGIAAAPDYQNSMCTGLRTSIGKLHGNWHAHRSPPVFSAALSQFLTSLHPSKRNGFNRQRMTRQDLRS
jgi:hypothetical protein